MLLQYGNSSLHLASRKGHAELCKLLLGAKADVEAKDTVREAKPLVDMVREAKPFIKAKVRDAMR